MKRQTISLLTLICLGCGVESKIQRGKANQQNKSEIVPLASFKGDSSSYVKKNFVENKNNYLHKPLSNLVKDNEIKIKSFMFSPDNISANCTSITLCADDRSMASKKNYLNKKPLFIYIDFEQPVPTDKIVALSRKNKGVWTTEEVTFFSNCQIKNIYLSDYEH